jgi:hypothetical protein
VFVLLSLAACGGSVEVSGAGRGEAAADPGRSAFGLWIAPSEDGSRFLPLDICRDHTISYHFPDDPSGRRERCSDVGGSYEQRGERLMFVVGSARLDAAIEDEGRLVLTESEGERVYFRVSDVDDITGTYRLRTILAQPDAERGAVTLVRTLRFDGERFTIDNVLSREGTDERWQTTERGTYAVVRRGELVWTSEGRASHVAHVVAFGARGEHLHIGRVGFMTRVAER